MNIWKRKAMLMVRGLRALMLRHWLSPGRRDLVQRRWMLRHNSDLSLCRPVVLLFLSDWENPPWMRFRLDYGRDCMPDARDDPGHLCWVTVILPGICHCV